MKRILAVIVLSLVTGCSLSFPQYEALRSFLVKPVPVDEQLAPFLWQLEWLGAESVVLAVVVDGGTAFVNREGLQLLFDGDRLRYAAGLFPYDRAARVETVDGGATLYLEQGVRLLETNCTDFSVVSSDENGFVWEQVCDGIRESNRKVVSVTGEIDRIESVVHPEYPAIVLTRLFNEAGEQAEE